MIDFNQDNYERLKKMAEGLVNTLPTLGGREHQVTYLIGYLAELQNLSRPKPVTAEQLRELFRKKEWSIYIGSTHTNLLNPFQELADMLGSTRS
jgi:hypothetical protein